MFRTEINSNGDKQETEQTHFASGWETVAGLTPVPILHMSSKEGTLFSMTERKDISFVRSLYGIPEDSIYAEIHYENDRVALVDVKSDFGTEYDPHPLMSQSDLNNNPDDSGDSGGELKSITRELEEKVCEYLKDEKLFRVMIGLESFMHDRESVRFRATINPSADGTKYFGTLAKVAGYVAPGSYVVMNKRKRERWLDDDDIQSNEGLLDNNPESTVYIPKDLDKDAIEIIQTFMRGPDLYTENLHGRIVAELDKMKKAEARKRNEIWLRRMVLHRQTTGQARALPIPRH